MHNLRVYLGTAAQRTQLLFMSIHQLPLVGFLEIPFEYRRDSYLNAREKKKKRRAWRRI